MTLDRDGILVPVSEALTVRDFWLILAVSRRLNKFERVREVNRNGISVAVGAAIRICFTFVLLEGVVPCLGSVEVLASRALGPRLFYKPECAEARKKPWTSYRLKFPYHCGSFTRASNKHRFQVHELRELGPEFSGRDTIWLAGEEPWERYEGCLGVVCILFCLDRGNFGQTLRGGAVVGKDRN